MKKFAEKFIGFSKRVLQGTKALIAQNRAASLFLALGLFALLLRGLGTLWPFGVERLYSRGVYPLLTKIISAVSGIFPFGLGQVLVPLLLALALFWLVRCFIRGGLKKFLFTAVSLVSLAFFVFIFSWGLNFNRLSLNDALGWQAGPSSKEDLRGLTEWLASEVNKMRPLVMEDENGVATSGWSTKELLQRAGDGYDEISSLLPWLSVKGSNQKPSLTPRFLSYSGIAGMYLFFSGEGKINCWQDEPGIAFSAMHEEAHRRGYSREDEANFLAALAGFSHPDDFFRYSALLESYVYASNALARVDKEAYKEISASLCEGAKRDIKNSYDFWKAYEGPVKEIAKKVNDSYLQMSGVSDGVRSYGRVVDLLIYVWKNGFLE
ncbi:MAG: DUF3810 domain-containing protein [Clostridiales bacterium]|nr:DUF3810 domain-containing protein [Clostridiales bacterium]